MFIFVSASSCKRYLSYYYPTCIDQSTVSKEPFVMRMYHGMNYRNTSADLISMHEVRVTCNL